MYGVSVCNDGDVRLADGRTLYEGRIEVCWNGTYGQWGSVCNDNWTEQNAKVTCRQLGFSGLSEFGTNLQRVQHCKYDYKCIYVLLCIRDVHGNMPVYGY